MLNEGLSDTKIIHMDANELIKEIKKLPIQKRIYVIEGAIHSIRKEEDSNQLKTAADDMFNEYHTDSELTAFTILDCENFYETRRDLADKP